MEVGLINASAYRWSCEEHQIIQARGQKTATAKPSVFTYRHKDLEFSTMGGLFSCSSSESKHSTTASSTPSSNHVEGETSTRAIEKRIEQSKSHWSIVAECKMDEDEEAEASNLEVFKDLRSHPKWGNFFITFGEGGGIGELVMGQKFAEGGQAELYDAHIQWYHPTVQVESLLHVKWALKVFKKGISLRQLQVQWPRGMLLHYAEKEEWQARGNPPRARNYSGVSNGTLLEDGRFAFLIEKEDEDLRHQIDRFMLTTRKNHCPFSKSDVEALMFKVALGVRQLHCQGIVHRDLKASNILCVKREAGWTCHVADFECSIGVVGTGFFRAPEILEACKDYSISDKQELFTKEADAYSYGMVCYEILTGKLPFEGYRHGDCEHVLLGQRPKIPKYVDTWIRKLLTRCWQANPIDRPSFQEILDILLANSKRCRELKAHRDNRDNIAAEKARRNV